MRYKSPWTRLALVLFASFGTMTSSLFLPQPQSSIPKVSTIHYNKVSDFEPSSYSDSLSESQNNRFKTFITSISSSVGERIEKFGGSNRGIKAALFVSYFTVMGAKVALPSTLSLLSSPESGLRYGGDAQKAIGEMLSISTIGIAFGKLLLGPLIDRLGGVLCLKVALGSLGLLLAAIAKTSFLSVFFASWIFVDFIFSSCWAASINAIHHSFSEKEWASQIGSIAVAARAGNALSFLSFASILQWCQKYSDSAQSWRVVFGISSIIQILPILLLMKYGNANSLQNRSSYHVQTDQLLEQSHSNETTSKYDTRCELTLDDSVATTVQPSSFQDSLRILRHEATTPLYWMHLVSRSSLMIIASFLLFVPSYFVNCFGISTAAAARVGSIYAFGCLLAMLAISKPYSTWSSRRKATVMCSMLSLLGGCSILQLLHISGILSLSPLVGTLSMFVWGACFAVPFYIPPSLYALRQGGKQSSATIADSFDLCGFLLLAWFNGFVAKRPQDSMSTWIQTYSILTGCVLSSLVSLVIALQIEGKADRAKQVIT